MIVSRKDDTTVIPKRKRVVKAVFRNAGEPNYEPYTQKEQVPTFNLAKRIRKPFGGENLSTRSAGVVPLKCNQSGSHAGAMLFNATEAEPMAPLMVPDYRATDLKQLQTEDVNPAFPNYDYLYGSRPSVRALKEVNVTEPTDPYPVRPDPATYKRQSVAPVPMRYQYEDELVKQVRGLL
jgi:hypothetical protein